VKAYSFYISITVSGAWILVVWVVCKLIDLPWPPKFHTREGAIRKLGENQYACLFGSLSWGLAMFFGSLVDHYLQGPQMNSPSAGLIAIDFVVWLGGGCLFGWAVWGNRAT
jgi:hypothetical protein